MKKQGLLLVLVTVIDLVTVWPFQGVPMRVVDVLIGLALLATLRYGEKPVRPADYFGVGERVHQRGIQGPAYGAVLGASAVAGLLRVQLDGEEGERQVDPNNLYKVDLRLEALDTDSLYFKRHAFPPSHS